MILHIKILSQKNGTNLYELKEHFKLKTTLPVIWNMEQL